MKLIGFGVERAILQGDNSAELLDLPKVNNLPTAVDLNFTTPFNSSITIDVLAENSDIDGDVITLGGVLNAVNGTVSIVSNEVLFVPDNDFSGNASFDYIITDENAASKQGTVTVQVAANIAPVDVVGNVTTEFETAILIDVLLNNTDAEGDGLTIVSVSNPTNGTAVIQDNKILYTPDNDYSGNEAINYVFTDGFNTVNGLANVTVNAKPPFLFGNGLESNSVTEFVSFASGLNAINSSSKASMHVWVNVQSGNDMFFNFFQSANDRFGLLIISGNLFFAIGNGNNIPLPIPFNLYNQKVLISIVFDGTLTGNINRLKGYVNGVQQALPTTGLTVPATLSPNISNDLFINRVSATSSTYGTAKYDELVITTDASTPEQIADFYNSGSGELATDCFTNILSYWDCNQTDGEATLLDRVGTADGNLNNFVAPYFKPFT